MIVLHTHFQWHELKVVLDLGFAKTKSIKLISSIVDVTSFFNWVRQNDFPFTEISLYFGNMLDSDLNLFKIVNNPCSSLKVLELNCGGMFNPEFNLLCAKFTQHPCYLREINIIHLYESTPKIIQEFNQKLKFQEIFMVMMFAKYKNLGCSVKIPIELIRMVKTFLI
jgi:hypothetical protein